MPDNLPPMLLKSLQLEYESTQISKDEMLKKYGYTEEQLPISSWTKLSTSSEITILPKPKDSEPTDNSTNEDEDDTATTLKNSINKTAQSLVTQINTLLIGADELGPKDIKEMAAALVSIKESTIGKDPTVVVNIDNSSMQNNLIQIANAIKSMPRDC